MRRREGFVKHRGNSRSNDSNKLGVALWRRFVLLSVVKYFYVSDDYFKRFVYGDEQFEPIILKVCQLNADIFKKYESASWFGQYGSKITDDWCLFVNKTYREIAKIIGVKADDLVNLFGTDDHYEVIANYAEQYLKMRIAISADFHVLQNIDDVHNLFARFFYCCCSKKAKRKNLNELLRDFVEDRKLSVFMLQNIRPVTNVNQVIKVNGDSNCSLLSVCVLFGSTSLVKSVLKKGAKIHTPRISYGPVAIAVQEMSTNNMIDVLIELGDKKIIEAEIYIYAQFCNNEEVINRFKDKVSHEQIIKCAEYIISEGCAYNIKVLLMVLDMGQLTHEDKENLLLAAAHNKLKRALEILFTKLTLHDFMSTVRLFSSVMIEVIHREDIVALRRFLDYGVEINQTVTVLSLSYLQAAVIEKKNTIVTELIRLGANVYAEDALGNNVLHYAVGGSVKLLTCFKQYKELVFSENSDRISPFHSALILKDSTMLSRMIKVFYIKSIPKNLSLSPITFAVMSDRTQHIDTLQKHDLVTTDLLNYTDKTGYTALGVAIIKRDEGAVEKLLDLGADPEKFDRFFEETPYDIAVELGYDEIAEIIHARMPQRKLLVEEIIEVKEKAVLKVIAEQETKVIEKVKPQPKLQKAPTAPTTPTTKLNPVRKQKTEWQKRRDPQNREKILARINRLCDAIDLNEVDDASLRSKLKNLKTLSMPILKELVKKLRVIKYDQISEKSVRRSAQVSLPHKMDITKTPTTYGKHFTLDQFPFVCAVRKAQNLSVMCFIEPFIENLDQTLQQKFRNALEQPTLTGDGVGIKKLQGKKRVSEVIICGVTYKCYIEFELKIKGLNRILFYSLEPDDNEGGGVKLLLPAVYLKNGLHDNADSQKEYPAQFALDEYLKLAVTKYKEQCRMVELEESDLVIEREGAMSLIPAQALEDMGEEKYKDERKNDSMSSLLKKTN